jgi:hypothetical protein
VGAGFAPYQQIENHLFAPHQRRTMSLHPAVALGSVMPAAD